MKQLLVLICLLVASLEADAQNWFRTAGPVEDDVLDLCIDSNGVLYAVTPLGVNRSTDGGESWTRPFLFPEVSSTPKNIIVAPNGNIIVSSTPRIYLSTDNGSTFIQRSSVKDAVIPFMPRIQFATTSSGRIYAGIWNYLIYSDNNGEDWKVQFGWGQDIYVSGLTASHDTVIASSEYDLRVSFDNGQTWQDRPGPGKVAANKLLVHPNGMWIWVSHFQGLFRYASEEQWISFLDSGPIGDFPTVDCFRNGSILVSSEDGIHQVLDTSRWIDVTAGLGRNQSNQYFGVNRFVEDPMRGIYYASTFGGGVWKSAAVLQSAGDDQAPARFSITPNPFTHRTTIHFTEANPSWTEIELRNILGVVVWKQGREFCPSGTNTLSIADHGLPPGNYLLVLRTSERTETQWVTIVK